MTELDKRKLRVISMEKDIPHHRLTIEADLSIGDFSMMPDERIYILEERDIYNMENDYSMLFQKYKETREELLRYKRLMKDFKLLMEEEE